MGRKVCELCNEDHATITFRGVELCSECYALYLEVEDDNAQVIQMLQDPYKYPKATERAFNLIINNAIKRKNSVKEYEELRAIELQKQAYAKSFNEFYEYDVVTIVNKDHGRVDKTQMMKILSTHAREGWRLHTMYSNELGKNALMIMGLGINSTACEDVLIFERRIEKA